MKDITWELKNLDSLKEYIFDELIGEHKNTNDINEAINKYAESYNEMKLKLLGIAVVSQQRELFSLADMKQAFEAGEQHKYSCYADGKERKCYCRKDDDCSWRKYQTFEDWFKTKENCG